MYTKEVHVKIYDDDSGDYIEIGPDADGIEGCIDIRDHQGEKVTKLEALPIELARKLADALIYVCDQMEIK